MLVSRNSRGPVGGQRAGQEGADRQFANVVTGAIVIENVFYLPGLGRLIFQSITNRDLFTVQALVLFFAAAVVIANFLVDVAYILAAPRLRKGAAA